MKISLKTKVAAAAAAVAIMGGTGIAVAYFTTTGAGEGSGSAGTSEELVLHGTVADALYPGTFSTVSFTVDNPSTGHQWVNDITLDSVTADEDHEDCVVTDFTMPVVDVDQDIPTGLGTIIVDSGTITMANNGNQDACKDAALTLHLSSN